MIQWKEGLSAALSNIAGQPHLSGFANQISGSTFLLQRWLDLHGIPVRVEIGERSHCSKGTPRHFLFKTKHFWRTKGKMTWKTEDPWSDILTSDTCPVSVMECVILSLHKHATKMLQVGFHCAWIQGMPNIPYSCGDKWEDCWRAWVPKLCITQESSNITLSFVELIRVH